MDFVYACTRTLSHLRFYKFINDEPRFHKIMNVPITGQAMGEALGKCVKEVIIDHGNHTHSINLMREK